MQHLFWLVPAVLAGRSGPTQDPWCLEELRQAGIGAVLSVNDGGLCHPEDFRAARLLYKCVPLSPNAPPRPGDLDHCASVLPAAFDFALSAERSGFATLVHCHAGKDRTGLFMAYYLCRRFGWSAAASVRRVKDVRPIALTADGWEEFALELLRRNPCGLLRAA